MTDSTAQTQAAASANNAAESGNQADEGSGPEKAQTFTQADLDKVVRERVARERAKYSDYDDLKTKASEKATVEDRLAAMEKRATDAEARALRADIATKHGISAEDRDLFLTGADEDALNTQAARLAERESERKKHNNVVPSEGKTPKSPANDEDRQAVRSLFGGD